MSMTYGVMVAYGWTGDIEAIAGKEITPDMALNLVNRFGDEIGWDVPASIDDEDIQSDPAGIVDELAREVCIDNKTFYSYDNSWADDSNWFFGSLAFFDTYDEIGINGWDAQEMLVNFAKGSAKAKEIYKTFFGYEPAEEPRFYVVNTCY